MNIFIYSTHLIYTPHVETELELMQLHLDKGDKIYRIICNGDLSICDINQTHELTTCLKCREVRRRGERLLDKEITNLPMVTGQAIHESPLLNKCKTIDDLIKLYYENFDIGYAVAASVVAISRNPDFNVEENKEIVNEYYKTALQVYLSAIEHINVHQPAKVYIFNGRFAHVRAVMRACEATKTDYAIHERGADKDHYDLFYNSMPHSINYWLEQQEIYWKSNKHSIEEKESIGADFYIIRKKGEPKDWLSFTKDQDQELLPDNFDNKKKNICIFNTSIEEFAAVSPEWEFPFYKNQEEFISTLMKMFEKYADYHFYLRVHPHLIGLNNNQMQRTAELNFYNLTVIPAASKVSSYRLLDNCDQIITMGSTMGIEAAYWNKPSILVAPALYSDSSIYRANSYEEVRGFLKADLPPKNNTAALKYGYYNSVKGIPFSYFKADTLFTGKFKNFYVTEGFSLLTRLIEKLNKIRLIVNPVYLYAQLYKKYKLKMH